MAGVVAAETVEDFVVWGTDIADVAFGAAALATLGPLPELVVVGSPKPKVDGVNRPIANNNRYSAIRESNSASVKSI